LCCLARSLRIFSSVCLAYPVRYMIYLIFGVSGVAERVGLMSSKVAIHLNHDVEVISNTQHSREKLHLLECGWWATLSATASPA
jgi:hypothetical protein